MRATPLLLSALLLAMPGVAAPIGSAVPNLPAYGIQRADAHPGDAADDTDYLFRLGMLEGHLMIGHELLVAGKQDLAMPHFGHPVRELYDDIGSYLGKHHAAPFDRQLVALETAVATAPNSPDTEAKYQATIAAVHRARAVAPAEIRNSVPQMIAICADTIDAASGEFNGALEHGRIESIVEYHDSRGFLEYVSQQVKELMDASSEANAKATLQRFADVLAKAEWIVEPLLPGKTPRASVGQYRAIAHEAAAVAKADKAD